MSTKNIVLISAIVIVLLMSTSSKAFSIIAKFEDLSLKPYLDTNGKWSIGYGTQKNWDLNRPVYATDRITKDTAQRWLKLEIINRVDFIKKLIKVPINQNQLDSLTSFAYNIGLGAFADSTLLKQLNQGIDKTIVANQFDRWVKANGKLLPALVTRRTLEKQLFLK